MYSHLRFLFPQRLSELPSSLSNVAPGAATPLGESTLSGFAVSSSSAPFSSAPASASSSPSFGSAVTHFSISCFLILGQLFDVLRGLLEEPVAHHLIQQVEWVIWLELCFDLFEVAHA